MSTTVEEILQQAILQHNSDKKKSVTIVSIDSVAPLSSSVVVDGKNEFFVRLIVEVDDIYHIGHLAIDWVDDADSGERFSDKIPQAIKENLLQKVPMVTQMFPHIENYAESHKEEFSQLPPWGCLGAYDLASLDEYVPKKRRLRVQCYNNLFYKPKHDGTPDILFFMFRMPRLAIASATKTTTAKE